MRSLAAIAVAGVLSAGALGAVAGPAVALPSGAAATAQDAAKVYMVVYRAGRADLVERPKRIGFGAANLVGGIRWSRWGGASGRGTARLTSTSGGADIDARVTIRAFRKTACGDVTIYSRFKLTRTSGDRIGALGRTQRAPCG